MPNRYFDGPHVMEGNELLTDERRVERAQERRLAALTEKSSL